MQTMSSLLEKSCSLPEAKSLGLDEACLDIINEDSSSVLEIWGQSKECYQCLPWKYAALKPNQSIAMAVNTTWETELFLRSLFRHKNLDSVNYHFTQHGWYQLNISSSGFSSINVEYEGNNEILDLVYATAAMIIAQLLAHGVFYAYQKIKEHRSRESADEDEGMVPDTPSLDDDDGEELQENELVDTRPQRSRRLLSLDAFRGLSVILMIFVNYGGGKYYFFQHSRWNGLTFADLVFPWFLWIMGTCIVFSVQSQVRQSVSHRVILFRIVRRSLLLFLIGIVLNGKSVYLPKYRFMGILQRLGLCYFINSVIELIGLKMQRQTQTTEQGFFHDITSAWFQWLITSLLVAINIIIVMFLAVPGCPTGYLGPGGLHMNGSYPRCTGGATGYIDRMLLGRNHVYQHPTCRKIYNNSMPFDPEGLLSTLMACLTVQLGAAAGRVVLFHAGHKKRLYRWVSYGLKLGILSGFLCNWSREDGFIPVNKNLWSYSFVLATGSFAFLLFSFLYVIIDMFKWYGGAPLVQAGRNPLLLYIGHEIMKPYFPWTYSPIHNTHLAHVAVNLVAVLIWVAIGVYLDSNSIYFII